MKSKEDILKKLGVPFRKIGERLTGKCPIHGGDNPTGFSMFASSGFWTCWTHHCELEHGKTFKGFIKAFLKKSGNYSEQEMLKYIEKTHFVSEPRVEIVDFDTKWEMHQSLGLKKNYLSKVELPSKYYLSRGFSSEILCKYCVTDCLPNYYMTNRAIVPSFSDDGEEIIGLSGRSVVDEHPKWLHSKGFKRNDNLYGYHNLKHGERVILTEGFAKVWKLEECGILNSVGIYGTHLSDNQIKLINKIAPNRVVIAMDNDEPGKKAAQRIKTQLELLYSTVILNTPIIDLDKASHYEIEKYVKGVV